MRSSVQTNRGQACLLQGLSPQAQKTPVLNPEEFFILFFLSEFKVWHFYRIFIRLLVTFQGTVEKRQHLAECVAG